MNTPVTTLDQRYSGPDTVATAWAQTSKVLEAAELFWICSVRSDGRPHVTPLVAVWVDGALHFHTGPTEQKAANLSVNPHVILMTGRNDWNSGLDVVVSGDAVRVTDDAMLNRLAKAWATKWDGQWQLTVRDGCFYQGDYPHPSYVFSVAPTQILAFDKGKGTHTSHQF